MTFKYNEDVILDEIRSYIETTYNQHYVNVENDTQLVDIVSHDELFAFAKVSALKYIDRFGKKEGTNRKDLLKAAHYVIMMMRIDTIKRGGQL